MWDRVVIAVREKQFGKGFLIYFVLVDGSLIDELGDQVIWVGVMVDVVIRWSVSVDFVVVVLVVGENYFCSLLTFYF